MLTCIQQKHTTRRSPSLSTINLHTPPLLLDIHTHHAPTDPGSAIVCREPDGFDPDERGWFSVGIHPWAVHASSLPDLSPVARLASAPNVLAIGETGIDHMHDTPLALQMELCRMHALLAERLQKPLILHMVRSAQEVMALKRDVRPAVPWIVHGFRGKPALARQLLDHGFLLSFGFRFNPAALVATPPDRLLLETDDATDDIRRLYAQVAALRGVSSDELISSTQANIARVFFAGRPIDTLSQVD